MSSFPQPSSLGHDLKTSDFDYVLPPELIAQTPLEQRDDSRLLVLDKGSGAIHHTMFKELSSWLTPGDLFVANNSRVIPARLRGHRVGTGGTVELLLLRQCEGSWRALAKPAKRLVPGTNLSFPAHDPARVPAQAEVEANLGEGEIRVRFADGADQHLSDYGEMPLPPYITHSLSDGDRYQTVYASSLGSAAAPTAGLHFTKDLLCDFKHRGFHWTEVTLHVGLDTFRPVTADHILDHRIHQEWCAVDVAAAQAIADVRRRGNRVVAVGTTAARTLETIGRDWGDTRPTGFAGMTGAFIVPGHRWTLVDALVTNFHLPRSTLLMMVSALAGREAVLRAYEEAVKEGYRFYSFGDAMLIR